MINQPASPALNIKEQKILEQIERIMAIRIKTLIINNLPQDALPEFKNIILENNPNILLSFAQQKIPSLTNKIYKEITKLKGELSESLRSNND